MEGEAVRAFVAVPLPPELGAGAAAVQERLRVCTGVKWVARENLHFTLRFLGNASPQALDLLARSLRDALADRAAFPITLGGVGAFPAVRRPQAIWIAVAEGSGDLEDLARRVESAAVAAGFPADERPFRAHLTVGRVKARPAPRELVRSLEAEPAGVPVGRMQVEEVVLMRSELRRTGPIYTPMASFPLRRSG